MMSSTLPANAELGGTSACSSPPPPAFAVLKNQTPGKKGLLLTIFCLAFFLDTVNNSALFTGIPAMATQLHIPDSQSVWLLSAYQLTFAALLLIVRWVVLCLSAIYRVVHPVERTRERFI
jgi:hypothetical protein